MIAIAFVALNSDGYDLNSSAQAHGHHELISETHSSGGGGKEDFSRDLSISAGFRMTEWGGLLLL